MIGLVRMPIGNLQSVWNALYSNGIDPIWVHPTTDTDALTHLVVPGVGHFGAVMQEIEAQGLAAMIRAFAASGRPLLGICVGMQLLADHGTEGGKTPGLGLLGGVVRKLPETGGLRLPHVGWNTVTLRRRHPVFEGVKPDRDFYFVHSYVFDMAEDDDCVGVSSYGEPFTAVVGRDAIVGTQFHPEKSQINGIRILQNFCHWDGKC